ncbi:MAG: DsrE family protein [Rhodobacteraceae bacterium]|nr:DsrE family protein [Paracoccaceae bacterium]
MLKTTLRNAGLAAAFALAPLAAQAEMHRIAFHVDQNDPQVMNLTLNNVNNVISYYESQGDEVEVQVVAYGPGLHMLRADTSPVAPRIAQMSLEHPGVTFQACNNTLQAMQRQAGTDIALLAEAHIVPAGVVQLVTLQEQGWSYIRP